MKLKNGFVLREVAGQTVVLPTGNDLDLNMMITLNETGRFLWERMALQTNENELVEALLTEYDVSRADAEGAVRAFVAKLEQNGFLEQ